ncbi:HesA/MoeB/ThiF family protein [Acinetobacter populi]|uniref:HesA/MoeB/ThiF family protein n=1 Tax=Acinetobacter populi TaxID=1582270 RepID=UPI003B5CF4E8
MSMSNIVEHTIALTDQELHLYSRQILLEGWDIDAQQRLKNSRVLIIGAGGIGCSCAELLARAGVGHLCIIDFDVIETSNLQRQIAFEPEDVGQYKVQTLVRRLKKINPHIEIEAITAKFDQDFVNQSLLNFDLVLDGCDNFATRYLVNQMCVAQNIPLLSAAAIGLQGQLLFVHGQPCYQCIFPEQDVADERRCANSGVLATTPVVMASLQAHHALLYLGLAQAPLLNKLLLWDGVSMKQRILNIQADKDCVCCAAKA